MEARISEICRQKRSISADTALRLERVFGATAKFWLGLQQDYDLEIAQQNAIDYSKIESLV